MQNTNTVLFIVTLIALIVSFYLFYGLQEARANRDKLLDEVVTIRDQNTTLQSQVKSLSADVDSIKHHYEKEILRFTSPSDVDFYSIIPSNMRDQAYVNRFVPDLVPIYQDFAVSRNYTEQHQAIDFATSEGNLVSAAAAGVIISRHTDDYLGNVIMIDHLNSYKTLYAHMKDFKVNINEFVEKGQPIGIAGNTGNSTSPHLHFQVYHQNDPIDPNTLMNISRFKP